MDVYITGTVAADNYNPLTSLVCYITYRRHHSIVGQIPPPPLFSPPLLEKNQVDPTFSQPKMIARQPRNLNLVNPNSIHLKSLIPNQLGWLLSLFFVAPFFTTYISIFGLSFSLSTPSTLGMPVEKCIKPTHNQKLLYFTIT